MQNSRSESAALEQQFRTALGMKVKITHNARGRGKLLVQFRNHQEFEQLKKHIAGDRVQRSGVRVQRRESRGRTKGREASWA